MEETTIYLYIGGDYLKLYLRESELLFAFCEHGDEFLGFIKVGNFLTGYAPFAH
jgi:hypothetical protein